MRKVIQICTDSQPSSQDWNGWATTTALCNDGTIWELEYDQEKGEREWKEVVPIPQPENGKD